ncbi:DsrE family protein [Allomuricauda sp. SCSIO 65647]|uniref:DsrE family protein n=1 Tax=Allomuricauda sp. SCSIO 65647 TaxID=2908843 RepID=UPI001F2B5A70|nr:DsrE family protein [Muricauda sp. SCSIO 65647]UJH67460.1 DsrE family protein [Muricauda sp. SCSIO 65647]
MERNFIFVLSFVFPIAIAFAQEKNPGPIIADYGAVWEVPDTDYETRTNGDLKVVFDIMNSPNGLGEPNKSIETAARFLNMHAKSGIKPGQMKVILVVHNKASKDILTNEGYQKRFGMNNPNAEMIRQLLDVGVQFVFCGQSSLSRNIPIEETISGVQLALSAMTALIQSQNDGYRLIKF